MSSDLLTSSIFSLVTANDSLRARLEAFGGPALLEKIRISAEETAQAVATQLPELGASGLRAAIAHTFRIADLTPEPRDERALLGQSAVLTANGEARLRLEDTARASVLDAAIGGEALSALLKEREAADASILGSDSADEDTIAGAWLRAFLRSEAVNLSRQSVKRLRAAVIARQAIDGVSKLAAQVPKLSELTRLCDFAELIEPLRLMVGLGDPRHILKKDRFAGRAAELKALRGFVDVLASQGVFESVSRQVTRAGRAVASGVGLGKARLMVIKAQGGLGKSALVAKFMLDHAVATKSFPFAYLDFDRATLQPRSPQQLLIETARQVAIGFPDQSAELSRLRERLRAGLANQQATDFEEACAAFRAAIRDILSASGVQTFLLVLDTMELVQSDPKAVEGVARFLVSLVGEGFEELAIVAAGRADIPELTSPEFYTDAEGLQIRWSVTPLSLPPLGVNDAVQMVNLLGESLMGEEWRHAWARQIAGWGKDPGSRREPLSLRIAVEIVRSAPAGEREKIVDEIGAMGESADDTFVGRLYQKRILDHISDPLASALAWPGLVVRRISREVARNVLGPICGLDPTQADLAFDRLAQEVWIVSREGVALRHRPDLRARTLPLMRRKNSETFRKIVSAMVDHHAARAGESPDDAAEAIYYRLLRGDDPALLDATWSDELAAALATARDDFEAGTPASVTLEARLATRLLPTDVFDRIPDRLVWEHVSRTGSSLRSLDDHKVDPRIVNLAQRAPPESALAPQVAGARQTVLIKAGAWSALDPEQLLFPDYYVDETAAACFAGLAAGAGIVSPAAWIRRNPDLLARVAERRGGSPNWWALAHSLLPALLYDLDFYLQVDRRLADALANHSGSGRRPAWRPVLRTAMLYGTRSQSAAARLYAWTGKTSGRFGGSIAASELRALLASQQARDVDAYSALAEMSRPWLADEGPRRIGDVEVIQQAFRLLTALAERAGREPRYIQPIRDYAAARLEPWVVPIGYAIAQDPDWETWRAQLRPLAARYSQFGGGWIGNAVDLIKNFQAPRDPIRFALLADEAGDLAGFLAAVQRHAAGERARANLKLISRLLTQSLERLPEQLMVLRNRFQQEPTAIGASMTGISNNEP